MTSPADGAIVTTYTPTFTGTGPPGTVAELFGAGAALIDASGNWAAVYDKGLVPGLNTVTVKNYACDMRTYDLSLPACGPPTSTIVIHVFYVPTTGAPIVALPVLVPVVLLMLVVAAVKRVRRGRPIDQTRLDG